MVRKFDWIWTNIALVKTSAFYIIKNQSVLSFTYFINNETRIIP